MKVAGCLVLCLGLSLALPGPSLEEFLESNGFGNVTENFIKEDVTMAVVRNLTDDDLKEMGLRTIGRRRQFMAAARTLNVPEVVREVEGEEGRKVRTGGVKLSSLLPKGMGKASTPASSSKRGSSTPRAPPAKRKREEGAETPVARVKKMKGKVASDSEDTEGEQVCGGRG